MNPITLTTAIPLTSAHVTDALTSFFGIGPVLGILALVLGLSLVYPVMRAVRALQARR